jgi:hypothetical protein
MAAAALVVVGAAALLRIATSADRWQEQRASSNASTTTLRLDADAPVSGWTRRSLPALVVACGARREPLVSLATGLSIEVERTVTRSVSVQLGDGPARMGQWILGDDHQTLIAPALDARDLVSRLSSTSHLEIGFVPLRSDPVLARFSVVGFARHWERLGDCHDADGPGGTSSIER